MSGNQTQPSAQNDPAVVKYHGPTPGPWVIFHADADGPNDILPAGRPGCIARDIERIEDAHLIAAAPDMLAALRGAMVLIDTMSWPEHPSVELDAVLTRRRTAVLAAIAKAVGDREGAPVGRAST